MAIYEFMAKSSRPKILSQNVELWYQLTQDFLTFRLPKIKRYSPFITIGHFPPKWRSVFVWGKFSQSVTNTG
jgi:hypothetical protein